MRKRTEEFNIKELLSIFIPKLWIIVIAALVFGMGMAVYSAFIKDDTYTSTTRIHVIKASSVEFEVNDVEFANSYLQSYIEVLKTPDTLNAVVIDFQSSYGQLYPNMTAEEIEARGWNKLVGSSIAGSITTSTAQDLLSVSVTTGDPLLSYGIATSIAKVIDEGKMLAYTEDIVKTKIVQVATPNAANSRKVVLNTIIGGAVGVVLSMVAIFIFNIADVTIRDKKKIEDNFDIPVLGVIPRFISDEGKVKK